MPVAFSTVVANPFAEPNSTTTPLEYVDPSNVNVDGTSCAGMTIRAATGKVLGDLHGFLIDPIARQLRYLVVGGIERTGLLPFCPARIDQAKHEIEVGADEHDFRGAREVFPALRLG
jgi:hypothetical protein